MSACNKRELWSKVPASFHPVLAQNWQQFRYARPSITRMRISKTKISYIFLWQNTEESDATISLPYAKVCKELKKMNTWILFHVICLFFQSISKTKRCTYLHAWDYFGHGSKMFIWACTFQNEKCICKAMIINMLRRKKPHHVRWLKISFWDNY